MRGSWANGRLGDVLNRNRPAVAPEGQPDAALASIETRTVDPTLPTLITFGGLAHSLQMPRAAFTRVIEPFAVNVLFVKDMRQAWYQLGLRGISRDLPACAVAIRALVPEQSTVVGALGMSSGGTGAVIYGGLMGLPRVLAFSPRTRVTREVIRNKRRDETPVPHFRPRSPYCDLAEALTLNPIPELDVHVGSANPADLADAAHLRGLPGVTIHGHPIAEHTSASWLNREGRLQGIIADTFGLTRWGGHPTGTR